MSRRRHGWRTFFASPTLPRAVVALLGWLVAVTHAATEHNPVAPRAVVWFVRVPVTAANGAQPDATVLRAAMARLVVAVTGAKNETAAWRLLVNPDERVGIKIARVGGWRLPAHRAIADAIAAGLRQAGVKHLVQWDGVRARPDYDPQATVVSPLLGRLIWGDLRFTGKGDALSDTSHWHRFVSHGVDRIINLATLQAHEQCGVAGALYNVTIPNLDNWRRFLAGPAAADPALCELYADDRLRPKIVLHLMDALAGQFAGGPEPDPNYERRHLTLYAAQDPVALDAVALRQINVWRRQAGLRPLEQNATWLQTADAMQLGCADPRRIALREAP